MNYGSSVPIGIGIFHPSKYSKNIFNHQSASIGNHFHPVGPSWHWHIPTPRNIKHIYESASMCNNVSPQCQSALALVSVHLGITRSWHWHILISHNIQRIYESASISSSQQEIASVPIRVSIGIGASLHQHIPKPQQDSTNSLNHIIWYSVSTYSTPYILFTSSPNLAHPYDMVHCFVH